MSKSQHRRIASAQRQADRIVEHFGKCQPRPAPRRQKTRRDVVAAAIREA